MATTPSQSGAVSGDVLMYKTPEPLNLEVHKDLGVTPSDQVFKFADTVHAVPIQVAEFPHVAVNYPIIFAGGTRQPLAIMGVRDNENLFISPEGEMERGAYIPAFIRRYPFVLANDEAAQRMVVCIDTSAAMLSEGGPTRLFENGEPTEYTRNAMKFCEDFETERNRTDAFVKLLLDLDLFDTRQTQFSPTNPDGTPGDPVALSEYFAVTPEKINALSPDTLVELRNNGVLALVYFHLASLNGWDRLMARALDRGPLDFGPQNQVRPDAQPARAF